MNQRKYYLWRRSGGGNTCLWENNGEMNIIHVNSVIGCITIMVSSQLWFLHECNLIQGSYGTNSPAQIRNHGKAYHFSSSN